MIPPTCRVVLSLLSLAALLACGQEEASTSPERRERALEKSPLPPAPSPAPASPYEADGRTLAVAAEPLLGVPLPRAARVLSKRPEIGRALVERVPFGAVERFYQRYVQTARVERSRSGVRFGDATPKAPGNPRARVEVYLRSTARGTLIAIYDESPSNRKAPRGDDAVRQARGDPGPIDYTKRIPGVTE